jgi:ADP-ribose pyrophosphatase
MKPEYKNPWTKLHSKEIYHNAWIKVIHHDVLNPAGNNGVYGVVEFQNYAIGILPIDDEGNIWLVGQYRFATDSYSWEIPEGGCPLGTDPLTSAQRELLEETGLKAENWQLIQKMHLSNSVSDEQAFIYIATGLSQHESEPEETEQLIVKKMPFGEAYKMVEEGVITDSITVSAILKAKIMFLGFQK